MSKFYFFLLIFIAFTFKAVACSCDVPKPAMEFYESDYVFEGNAISKIYASDSLTYVVKFKVLKHYKDGDKPKFISYTLKAEGEFTGEFNSCDWNVEEGEKWLIYSEADNKNQRFSFNCSNSKPLGKYSINEQEQRVLNNGNNFQFTDYRYSSFERNYNTNVDSLLSVFNAKNQNLKSEDFAFLWFDVDREGNTTNVNLAPRHDTGFEVVDTMYGMNLRSNTYEAARNDFEKRVLELANKIKQWQPISLYGTPVKSRVYLAFKVNDKGRLVVSD